MIRTSLLAALALALAGCATIPREEKLLLTQPVDCDEAEQTIQQIREARPTDIDRARVLAATLTLGGFAYGVLTNDMADRHRLMSGEYDEELTARIREIAQTCDIPVPELD